MKDVPQRLPLPLQRFYKRHGRRPSLNGFEVEFFYEGGGLHHLFQPKHLEFDKKSRVKFFMEYQGDFNGFTEQGGDDPPVWLKGHLPETEFARPDYGHNTLKGEFQLDMTLSQFLATHILITTLSEAHNSEQTLCEESDPIYGTFKRARSRKQLVWEASDPTKPHCTWFIGKIWLFRDEVLVHEFLDRAMFSTRTGQIPA